MIHNNISWKLYSVTYVKISHRNHKRKSFSSNDKSSFKSSSGSYKLDVRNRYWCQHWKETRRVRWISPTFRHAMQLLYTFFKQPSLSLFSTYLNFLFMNVWNHNTGQSPQPHYACMWNEHTRKLRWLFHLLPSPQRDKTTNYLDVRNSSDFSVRLHAHGSLKANRVIIF